MEEENNVFQFGKILPAILQQKPASAAAGPIFSPYYEEYRGEFEESCESPCVRSLHTMEDGHGSSTSISHHSDHCVFCQAFRKFLDSQPEEVLLTYRRPSTNENVEEVTADSAKPSESANEEIAGSTEGLATDTAGENEEAKGKAGRKESASGQQQNSLNTQELAPHQVISATSSKVKTHHKVPAMSVQKSATVARQSKEKKKKQ